MIRVLIKVLALSFSLSVTSTYALDCTKADIKDIAYESVVRELKGASLSARPKCLDEHNFKTIKPVWLPPIESVKIFDIGVLDDSLKITELKLIDSFVGEYEVSFEAKADKHFGGALHKSKMTIVTKLEEKMKERNGCALTLIPPKKTMLMRSCYVEALKAKGLE